MYLLIGLLGTLTASICVIWKLFSKGGVRSKLMWVGVVLLTIAVDVAVAPYLIDTSYRIYLAGHKDVLSEANKIFIASKGDVWVMNDSVRLNNSVGMSKENRQKLLGAQKQLGVYMIYKSDSTIHYGLWGFLDVRLGITYFMNPTAPSERYRHLTGSWYH